MHDGQQFLIQKYSLARIPAFKLTDSNYTDLRNAQVLAMGASDFAETANSEPLPAVPLELGAIARQWRESIISQPRFHHSKLAIAATATKIRNHPPSHPRRIPTRNPK
jgi:CHAT domain-containing protein